LAPRVERAFSAEFWQNPPVSDGPKRWISSGLYALPLVTVGVVCFALYVVAAPRPYPGARVYGGATLGVEQVSFRVEVVERLEELEAPLVARPIRVEAELGAGPPAVWRGRLDALGMAHPYFRVRAPSTRPARIRVTFDDSAQPALADGQVALDAPSWTKQARELGGWLNGRRSGSLHIDVAAAEGVFAIPFAGPVMLRVTRGEQPVPGVALHVEGDGLVVVRPRAGQTETTDDGGRALAAVSPLEHVASLRVVAEARSGERGTWYATLPILPGALHASLEQNRLRVASPIARDVAFFMLSDGRARLLSGSVPLAPDGRGGAVGSVDLPIARTRPLWAIVSSEAPLNSPGAVGWPLAADAAHEPPHTWTVADALLLDGLMQGFAHDQRRKAHARQLAGGFSAGAALLIVLLLIGRVQSEDARLATHLAALLPDDAASQQLVRPRKAWALAVAAVCIALGFMVVALVAMYRI
jgi:hypothetical protein